VQAEGDVGLRAACLAYRLKERSDNHWPTLFLVLKVLELI